MERDDAAPEYAMDVPFVKMSGSGNDFILLDARVAAAIDDVRAFTRAVCHRRLSLGADGVVVIDPHEPQLDLHGNELPDAVHFTWRYLNADGSDGEMCGNGAMCGARYAVQLGFAPDQCRFQTPSGIVEAMVDDESGEVTLMMPDTGPVAAPVTVLTTIGPLELHPVRVGVPHVVAIVPDADAIEHLDAIGRAIRRDPHFEPDGTNVNVISPLAPSSWRMRTYERGVEAETLACGTGAIATGVVTAHLGRSSAPVSIRTSGGRDLQVSFKLEGDAGRNVRLTGHTAIIAQGVLLEDAWNWTGAQ